MAKYWVQAETRHGRVSYGVYRMSEVGPECYESFADRDEAQEYCDERNDPRNDPWWPVVEEK